MDETHVCWCPACRPGVFPKQPEGPTNQFIAAPNILSRPSPAWARELVDRGLAVDVVINGSVLEDPEDATVVEVLIGNGGYVLYLVGEPSPEGTMLHLCACGAGLACARVRFGAVEIRMQENGPSRAWIEVEAEVMGVRPFGIDRGKEE